MPFLRVTQEGIKFLGQDWTNFSLQRQNESVYIKAFSSNPSLYFVPPNGANIWLLLAFMAFSFRLSVHLSPHMEKEGLPQKDPQIRTFSPLSPFAFFLGESIYR